MRLDPQIKRMRIGPAKMPGAANDEVKAFGGDRAQFAIEIIGGAFGRLAEKTQRHM